jgi:hypothetical protein
MSAPTRVTFVVGAVLAAAFEVGGCERSLDGAPCPCLTGWVCCAGDNTCHASASACPGAHLDGTGGSDGGPGSSSGDVGGSGGADAAGGGDGASTIPPSPDVTISPASATVSTRRRLQFSANQAVTFSITEGPSGGSIDANGLYMAPATAGSAHVVASNSAGKSATAAITIRPLTLDLVAGQLAGAGNLDGVGTRSYFSGPSHMAGTGGLLVVTETSAPAFRSVATTGRVTTLPLWLDGDFTGLPEAVPLGAVVWVGNRLWVAVNGALCAETSEYVVKNGVDITKFVTTVGSRNETGTADGAFAAARFRQINALAWDANANAVYALDYLAIRKIDLATAQVTTLAGDNTASSGFADDVGPAARFLRPWSIALGEGVLYISDVGRVRALDLQTRAVTTLAGGANGGTPVDGVGANVEFAGPQSLAYDGAGTLWVGDAPLEANDPLARLALRKIDVRTREVTTVIGSTQSKLSAVDPKYDACPAHDGPSGQAIFSPFTGDLVLDGRGHAFVADRGNNAIRQVDLTTLDVTTLAGAIDYGPGVCDPSGDGWSGAADIVADGPAQIVTIDGSTHVRAVDLASKTASTLVDWSLDLNGLARSGDGSLFAGQGSSLVQIDRTRGTAAPIVNASPVWPMSDIHALAMNGNNVFALSGTSVATLALSPGASDGGATWSASLVGTRSFAAGVLSASSMAAAPGGTLFLTVQNAVTEMPLAATSPSILAGNFTQAGFQDGSGGNARFEDPIGLAVDDNGDILVADSANGVIRRIDHASGEVSTELGVAAVHGVQPGALPTSLNDPQGVAVLANGDLVITDENAVLWLH